jgi:alkylhydroperoxidase family enzyme
MILSLEKFTTSAPLKVSNRKKRRTKVDSAMVDIESDTDLMDIVRLRVVQILGCKCCMREESMKLKANSETDRRLRLLKNWRSETAFSLREKAALNLAEAVTCNPISSIPRGAIYAAQVFFTEEQMILFVLETVAINDWHYLKSFQHDKMMGRLSHE